MLVEDVVKEYEILNSKYSKLRYELNLLMTKSTDDDKYYDELLKKTEELIDLRTYIKKWRQGDIKHMYEVS